MATATIPVDVLNPGQVFACIGFAEIASVLFGNASGAFDWSAPGRPQFQLQSTTNEDPIAAVLAFLDGAEVVSVAPEGSPNRTEKWTVPTVILAVGSPFPNGDGNGPPQLPARLRNGNIHIDISYWGDHLSTTGRDNVKFWAGSGGYPGAALVRDAMDAFRGKAADAKADPFNFSALLGANLRLDWRGGYVPLDAGFSLNKHGSRFHGVSFPIVEVLAAVGLSHSRPLRVERLHYRYGVIAAPKQFAHSLLPLPLLRAAIGAVPLPFPQRTFNMILGWAGQEGQARTITSSVEEFSQ